MILNKEALQQYREEGYTLTGRVLDDAQLESIRAEELRFREAQPYDANTTVFRSQLARHSEIIRSIITSPRLVEVAKQLIGPNVCHWFNQFVTKMPDAQSGKSEFPWHQDNGYGSIVPATDVTIWIALDDVDTRNGCVYVVPRSHEKGLLEHKSASADNWHLTLDVEGDGIPAVLKAGEAVAFTGLTLHRSLLNHSDHARRGFFVEYADPAATVQWHNQSEVKPVTDHPNTWLVAGELPYPLAEAAVGAY